MTRPALLGILALAALLGVDSARAQAAPADSANARRTVTVPLPVGRGVFYYRSGPPGGVGVRGGRRARPAAQAPVSPARPAGGVTEADLLQLELDLLRALDGRLADLRTALAQPAPPPSGAAPGSTVIVPVPTPSSPTPLEPRPAPQTTPDAALVPPAPRPAGEALAEPDVTVERVERALLDLGLFRTTRVPFAFGEADLLPVARQTLDVVGDVLVRFPDLAVEVGGHTDAVSSAAFNLALSRRRADAVRWYLLDRFPSLRPGRVAAVGYGEARPVATNETETGRALNRRVEFTVVQAR